MNDIKVYLENLIGEEKTILTILCSHVFLVVVLIQSYFENCSLFEWEADGGIENNSGVLSL